MAHDTYTDDELRAVLAATRTIAMVGASPKAVRPSHYVMKYLQMKGFRVIPVNPGAAGQQILGEPVYASLAEVPEPFDMVDIFRNSEAAGETTDEALALPEVPGIIWMQDGVRNDAAAERAEAAGARVIMNRCVKREYARLNGELSWGGMNSRIISSKRRKP